MTGKNITEGEIPLGAEMLLALAAEFEREAAGRSAGLLIREGTIRGAVFRQAAEMARARARAAQDGTYTPGPGSADTPAVSGRLTGALSAADEDYEDLYEDGWPL